MLSASTSSCNGDTYAFHEFSVTGAHTGAVYTHEVGRCTLYQSAVTSDETAYDLGPEIPPDQFVAFTTSVNPPFSGP